MAIYKKTAIISIGETMSDSIPQNELVLAGLVTGSVVTADELTFLGSFDGENFHSIYDETSEVSVTTASYTRAFTLTPEDFLPWRFIKIREGNSASGVAQATYDASFDLIFTDKI